jgi:hypothetical protein
VSPPLNVNQPFTEPQCMIPSAMQMQPRCELAVFSAVKQTALVLVQATPFSDTLPAGAAAGGIVAAYPCGLQLPPLRPAGKLGGGEHAQLNFPVATSQRQSLNPAASIPQV